MGKKEVELKTSSSSSDAEEESSSYEEEAKKVQRSKSKGKGQSKKNGGTSELRKRKEAKPSPSKEPDVPVGPALVRRVSATGPRAPGVRKDYHFKLFKTPKEGVVALAITAAKKCNSPWYKQLVSAMMAGIYIGFGAHLMMQVIGGGGATLSPGLLNLVGSSLFPYGLMMVVFTGSELFTGNILVDTVGLLNRTVRLPQVLRHLCISWIGNFIGSVLLAFFAVWLTDVMRDSDLVYAKYAATVIMKKVADFGWGMYFMRAVFCNILVCMAVYMAMISESQEGKILSIWWPVTAFLVTGMEHSIANMFTLPACFMLLGSNEYGGRDPADLTFNYTDFRGDIYLVDMGNRSVMDIRHTQTGFPNFGDFIAWNLIPVTLGNIVGGALLGCVMFFIFLTPRTDNPPSRDN